MSWLEAATATVPTQTGWLLAVALLVSSLGFVRTVYFVSIGYGFSIAAMALVSLPLSRATWTWAAVAQAALLAAYGMRLGLYLARRQRKPGYRRALQGEADRPPRQPLGMSLLIWLGVSVLYVLMFSPASFSLTGGPADSQLAPVTAAAGLALMAVGLGLEAWADRQKSALKAARPDQFCSTGLYRLVRCPNYLGEILVWVGNVVAGAAFFTSWLRWAMALIGLVCIVLIMMGSTKRLEQSQQARYGQLPEYQAYVRTVPVLVPFVPIYSLRNVRVYLE